MVRVGSGGSEPIEKVVSINSDSCPKRRTGYLSLSEHGKASFQVLKWRWSVERTLAWLNFNRRLSMDFELLPETGDTWIYLCMSRLMLRRLAKTNT